MKIIDSMKAILKEFSRDRCYQQMEKDGHACYGCCPGRVGGDMYTGYLSYECVGCSYLVTGFEIDRLLCSTKTMGEPVECPCCRKGEPLVETLTSDFAGIVIQNPNLLTAYGYDIRKNGCSRIAVKINYCPMCGRSLKL